MAEAHNESLNLVDLECVIKMGATELPFPEGVTDPEVAKEMYAANFPHLRQARLREPEGRGEKLVYEVEKAPVKTKG